jgi:hypothetical protein
LRELDRLHWILEAGLLTGSRRQKGSYLTVVCSAPELESFGRLWPEFVHS